MSPDPLGSSSPSTNGTCLPQTINPRFTFLKKLVRHSLVESGIIFLTLKNSFCAGENLKKKRRLTLVTLASDSSSEEDWAVETSNGIWKTCSQI